MQEITNHLIMFPIKVKRDAQPINQSIRSKTRHPHFLQRYARHFYIQDFVTSACLSEVAYCSLWQPSYKKAAGKMP